jgi:hypothetical protein
MGIAHPFFIGFNLAAMYHSMAIRTSVMTFTRAIPLLFALAFVPAASAQVYKCVGDDGKIAYTNDRDSAKSKGCKVLDNDQAISTVPMSSGTNTNAKAPTPPNFPNVGGNTQRTRDAARRQVLEGELATEQQALDAAKQALTEQEATRSGDERNYQKVLDRLQPFKDKVEQHERNIEALNKEISGLN